MSQSFRSTHASTLDNTFQSSEEIMETEYLNFQKILQVCQNFGSHAQALKILINQLEKFMDLMMSIKHQRLSNKLRIKFVQQMFKKVNQKESVIRDFFFQERQPQSRFFIAAIIQIKIGRLRKRIQNSQININQQAMQQIQRVIKRILIHIKRIKRRKQIKSSSGSDEVEEDDPQIQQEEEDNFIFKMQKRKKKLRFDQKKDTDEKKDKITTRSQLRQRMEEERN